MYHVGMKSFGLSYEDAQDKDDWILENWEQIKISMHLWKLAVDT